MRTPSKIVALLATLAMMIGACADAGDKAATDSAPANTTVTSAPPETVVGAFLDVDEPPLVYVSLGPSGNFFPNRTAGMIFLYADMLQERFGVEVDHRDHTIGGDSAPALLERMKASDRLRQNLAEAHVVTIMFPIDHWVSALQTSSGYQGRDPADCGGTDNQDCLRDAAIIDRQHVDDLLGELTRQCPPDQVLIRIADTYMIHSRDQAEAGSLETVVPYWSESQAYIEEAAAGYGIPVAHVFETLNGPTGLDDPMEKGLMLDDQEHPNEAGARLMADLVDSLGYELAD